MTVQSFRWWRVSPYGTAEAFEDTPTIRARVDTERGWFGSVEGTILHAGVLATAYKRHIEQLFDAEAWLLRGERVPTGTRTVTEITAKPEMLAIAFAK